MESFYIERQDLVRFLETVAGEFNLYCPKNADKDFSFTEFQPHQEIVYNEYRTIEPLKAFLSYIKERLAIYFVPPKSLFPDKQKIALLGTKACDLTSLKIQDFVFKEGNFTPPLRAGAGFIDPLYAHRRDNLFIISSDCTSFKEVCFCLALDIMPYPTEGFDLNISMVNNGFIVEVGSPKGKEFIEKDRIYFQEPTKGQLAAQRLNRQHCVEKLKIQVKDQKLPPKDSLHSIVKDGFNSNIWKDKAQTCVECGGCNFICPTCHCFLLADQIGEREEFQRTRCWDACQYPNFARVAGGANPLMKRNQRLRNRFLKKFDFFPENINTYACTGCGRCIETCPGKIDIREILRELAFEVDLHKYKKI